MPTPPNLKPPRVGEEDNRPDEVDDALAFAAKAAKVRALNSIGLTPEKSEEKTTINVAELVKSQTDLSNNLLTQMLNLSKNRPEDPFYKFLVDELKASREKLDELSQSDPIGALAANMETIDKLGDQLKKRLGVAGPAIPSTGADVQGMIRLEEMKLERENAQRRWESERDDIHRRWQIEDDKWKIEMDKWKAEFELKREEVANKAKAGTSVSSALGDIVSALVTAVDTARTESEAPAEVATRAPQARVKASAEPPIMPKEFTCHVCKKIVSIPPNQDPKQTIKCECGAEYDFTEQ